jgi:hypothetical protein
MHQYAKVSRFEMRVNNIREITFHLTEIILDLQNSSKSCGLQSNGLQ